MDNPLRILVVEDSEDDALLIVHRLKHAGYQPMFERVDDANAMRAALSQKTWDVIIADHNMPQFNSFEALALAQETGLDIPFIIVSGSIGEEIAVDAMKAGAQDYVMKDNLARLIPAIKRELNDAEVRSARRKAEETIRYLAFHDSLTGLVNRGELERRLQRALIKSRLRGKTHALLYIDLDQFKIVNDTCGHAAGDEFLRQIGALLKPYVRDNDTLARMGGDEFCVLLESCPLEQGEKIAMKILKVIKDHQFRWYDHTFTTISASVGMVLITELSTNVQDVLANADMACYAAKEQGRNRIHLYTDSDADIDRRRGEMQWVARINQALDENRFVLYQQCIVPVAAENAAKHCEFLLRLRDRDGNVVLPDNFIPSAEHFNLMPTLDRWVTERAFAFLAEQNASGKEAGTEQEVHFINLSGTSLSDHNFFGFILAQMKKHNIAPESICFEITETAAIMQLGRIVEFIKQIKEHGFQFALDDFGSGMCSFSYLKSIPVDYLKIDGSFVRKMLHDPVDYAIVGAVNQVSQVAGIRTIAESVETREILKELKKIGVDYGQGFGVESPRPVL